MFSFVVVVLMVCLLAVAQGAEYTVGYVHPQGAATLMNAGMELNEAAGAFRVADLVARLSDLAPLNKEEVLNLPAVDIQTNHAMPLIVEIQDGAFPSIATKAVSFSDANNAPALADVLHTLKTAGIPIEGRVLPVGASADAHIRRLMKETKRPVIVLHNMDARRRLQSTETLPITQFEIADYQICMWTGIVLFVLVISAISAIANMEVIPDSLLYAKFQSGRTDKRD